jgi:outer membrane immunogenic protein
VGSAYQPISWTGFYIGGDVGRAWADSAGSSRNAALDPRTALHYDISLNGIAADGFVGAQLQWQKIVVGIEGDIQSANITGKEAGLMCCAVIGPFGPYTFSTKVESYGSVRARLGFAADRWLFFATGGWALAHWQTSYSTGGPPPFFINSTSRQGWTAGVGASYAMTNNVFLTMAYRFTDLNASGYSSPSTFSGELGNTVKIDDFRAGIGVKF